MTLPDAFHILGVSEKDINVQLLETALTANLETSEFHDIPKLLEAYRTINGLLEQQIWQQNTDKNTIVAKLEPSNPENTLPVTATPAIIESKNIPLPIEVQESADELQNLEFIPEALLLQESKDTDSDALIVSDDELLTKISKNKAAQLPSIRNQQPRLSTSHPLSVTEFEPNQNPNLISSSSTSFASPTLTERPANTQPRIDRISSTLLNPEIDNAMTTVIVTPTNVPDRRSSTSPWVVGLTAITLTAAGLWGLQTQFHRTTVIGLNPVPSQAVVKKTETRVTSPSTTKNTAFVSRNTSQPTIVKVIQKPVAPIQVATSQNKPAALVRNQVAKRTIMPKKPKLTSISVIGTTNPLKELNKKVASKAAFPDLNFPVRNQVSSATQASSTVVFRNAKLKPPRKQNNRQSTNTNTVARIIPVIKVISSKPVVKPRVIKRVPNVVKRIPSVAKIKPKPATIAKTNVVTVAKSKPIIPKFKNAPKTTAIKTTRITGLPDNLTREEYGRRYFNKKIYEVWQRSNAQLRYGTWEAIPIELQKLNSAQFRTAVYIADASSEDPILEAPK